MKAGMVNMSPDSDSFQDHATSPKPEPKPTHTVLDDQPLEHINFTHTVDPNLLYAVHQQQSQTCKMENHQP